MKPTVITILSLFGILATPVPGTPPAPALDPSLRPDVTVVTPINDFRPRITKKFFGTYVTPQNSPVTPERFTGYHTGVDVEYGDISGDVPVNSIAAGVIIYSGWVSGYGGVVAESFYHDHQSFVAVYGHLDPSRLIDKNQIVPVGMRLGFLGKPYSSETDGERRHLHLSILKGSVLNLRGYVSSRSALSAWVDPLTLLP